LENQYVIDMKNLILFFSFAVFTQFGLAQQGEEFNPYTGSLSTDSAFNTGKKFDLEQAKKLDFSLEFGTGIESYMSGSGAFYTYTAPALRYAINRRFAIRMGVMLMNIQADNLLHYNSEGIVKSSGNFMQTWFYTAGDFYATEKIRITGEVLYGNSMFQNNAGQNNFRPKAFSLGAEFKVNDNFQIGIKIGERHASDGMFRSGSIMPNGF